MLTILTINSLFLLTKLFEISCTETCDKGSY